MRACIFVDGENFRHSLIKLFGSDFNKEAYLPQRARWTELFDYLCASNYESKRVRTYWYTVNQILFSPGDEHLTVDSLKTIIRDYGPTLFKRLLSESRSNSLEANLRWVIDQFSSERAKLAARFAGWKKMEDWMAANFDSLEFRRAGSIRYSLYSGEFGDEKAVDVKLATDLLELRNVYDLAIIISGDQDYVPAVQIIKDSGKKVVNVVFKARNGRYLPGGAQALNVRCDKTFELTYDKMSEFMNLPSHRPKSAISSTPTTPAPSQPKKT